MNASHVRHVHLLIESEAESHAGGAADLAELLKDHGLSPYRKVKGFVFFTIEDIDEALHRRAVGRGGTG